MTKKSGFTLIELLVVIAIIAIITAIFFPVFATAREKARQTSCTSNMKQLSLGVFQYAQDYDETLPCGTVAMVNGYTNFGVGWAGQIYPYLKSIGVYACPNDTTQPTTNMSTISYAYNWEFVVSPTPPNTGATWQTFATTTLAQLVAPASTVLYYEVLGYNFNTLAPSPIGEANSPSGVGVCNYNETSLLASTNDAGPCGYSNVGTTATTLRRIAGARHSGGAVFVMADGHVKWLRPELVSVGITSAARLVNGSIPAAVPASNLGSYTATFDYTSQ